MKRAQHGGAFFDAIGPAFDSLSQIGNVVSADVLDAWFPPSPNAIKAISDLIPELLQTSPPIHASGLIQTLSETRSIPADNILVSNGSSSLIFAVLPRIIKANTTVVSLDPSYSEYPHVVRNIIGGRLLSLPLAPEDDFQLSESKFIKHIQTTNPDFLIIVNPNSPTGSLLDKEVLLSAIKRFPNTTFIVDEAYIDFVGTDQSVESHVPHCSNLVVIKSMSKVYALSGARVGYAVCPSWVIDAASLFFPPWPVSLIAQVCAVRALQDPSYYREKYEQTHQLRRMLASSLANLNFVERVYPSVANFVLIKLTSRVRAEALVRLMKRKNIFLRDCTGLSPRLGHSHVRIAVKSEAVNQMICESLAHLSEDELVTK